MRKGLRITEELRRKEEQKGYDSRVRRGGEGASFKKGRQSTWGRSLRL